MKKLLFAIATIATLTLCGCDDKKQKTTDDVKNSLAPKLDFNKKIDCSLKQSSINEYNRIYHNEFDTALVRNAYDSTVVFDKALFSKWLADEKEGNIVKIVYGVYTADYETGIRNMHDPEADVLANYIHEHLGKLTVFAVTYKKDDLKTPISCYNIGTLEP